MDVIIVGGGRQVEKQAMMRHLLKERSVLIGVDFGDVMNNLYAAAKASSSSVEKLIHSINEIPLLTPDKMDSMNDYFRDEAKKLCSFQDIENTIVYEKPQSKFISRPRNNFIKR